MLDLYCISEEAKRYDRAVKSTVWNRRRHADDGPAAICRFRAGPRAAAARRSRRCGHPCAHERPRAARLAVGRRLGAADARRHRARRRLDGGRPTRGPSAHRGDQPAAGGRSPRARSRDRRRHDGSPSAVEPAARGTRPVPLRVVAADRHFDHGLPRLAARSVGRPAATGAGAAGARPFGAVAAARPARHRVRGQPLDAVQPGQAPRPGAWRPGCRLRCGSTTSCPRDRWSIWRKLAIRCSVRIRRRR